MPLKVWGDLREGCTGALADQVNSFETSSGLGSGRVRAQTMPSLFFMSRWSSSFGGPVGKKPSSAPLEMQPQAPTQATEAQFLLDLGGGFVHGPTASLPELLEVEKDDVECG